MTIRVEEKEIKVEVTHEEMASFEVKKVKRMAKAIKKAIIEQAPSFYAVKVFPEYTMIKEEEYYHRMFPSRPMEYKSEMFSEMMKIMETYKEKEFVQMVERMYPSVAKEIAEVFASIFSYESKVKMTKKKAHAEKVKMIVEMMVTFHSVVEITQKMEYTEEIVISEAFYKEITKITPTITREEFISYITQTTSISSHIAMEIFYTMMTYPTKTIKVEYVASMVEMIAIARKVKA